MNNDFAQIPEYMVLDADRPLKDLIEAINVAFEQNGESGDRSDCSIMNQMVDDYIDNIFACLQQKDVAWQALGDYINHLMMQEHLTEMVPFKISEKVYFLGQHLYKQLLDFGCYLGQDYIPYFYHGRINDDAVIMMRDIPNGITGKEFLRQAARQSDYRDSGARGYCLPETRGKS
jgi:hypothetical protein